MFGSLEEVDTGSVPSTLRSVLEERRQQVVHLLELQLQDPTLGASSKQGVLRVLSGVAGNVHAVHMMLSTHSKLLRQQQQQLLKPHRTGASVVLAKVLQIFKIYTKFYCMI